MKRSVTPGEMARQLRISERQLYKYLKYMRNQGAPIHFNRKLNRYVYRESGYFFIGFIRDT